MNERHFVKMARKSKYKFRELIYHTGPSCIMGPVDMNNPWYDEWGEKQFTPRKTIHLFRCWVIPGFWQPKRWDLRACSMRYDFELGDDTKIKMTVSGEKDGTWFTQYKLISQNEFKKICQYGVYADPILIQEMVCNQILENKREEEKRRLEELQNDFE